MTRASYETPHDVKVAKGDCVLLHDRLGDFPHVLVVGVVTKLGGSGVFRTVYYRTARRADERWCQADAVLAKFPDADTADRFAGEIAAAEADYKGALATIQANSTSAFEHLLNAALAQ